ncbi:NAD(P)-dependent oxidoreductase [Rhizobium sp. RM]|uniref:NAD-dependent epimerase/dehydratase family protein n=1 Tax=Rhizobium sp. RM TaxID=2748079 RepID=UPI00110EB193|nr:NAD(P)-dependent oxidoreductase [Rhizobium sp. RM]NWJ27278.1 NAD(P)-dependent oxidoreductase [Rhizobium sp. RM]TMV20338.1 NAD(P)-dependent oxidoreductase [Rhizobium sp. Td3]
MKVLLTGASSFTGYWFAEMLVSSGFKVVAPLRGSLSSYNEGVRAERVRRLLNVAEVIESAPFGSENFQRIAAGGFDILCHHAAQVANYRSPEFDVVAAVGENTHNLRGVLTTLRRNGLKSVVLTGSVFEQNEGAGNQPLLAFSPYGLSKGLTSELVKYHCREFDLAFGKFVIPNPFGPLEEPRFAAYLMRTWKQGEVARVNTPDYVRDNIHVRLLASAYAKFVSQVAVITNAELSLNPSGYVETQGAFAQRFANSMRDRLQLDCALELGVQNDFSEPLMRVNTQSAAHYVGAWDENSAWRELADSYR